MAKVRPILRYYYRGPIERGPRYEWRDGYSTGEDGIVSYPWMTRGECRSDAKRRGFKAVFEAAAMTQDELKSWIAETEQELETCPPGFKASVQLRLDELRKKLNPK